MRFETIQKSANSCLRHAGPLEVAARRHAIFAGFFDRPITCGVGLWPMCR